MLHRYAVVWSAPNYRDSGMTFVMAGTAPGAVTRAKKKLGSKVKTKHLSKFRAWRREGTHQMKLTEPRYVG